MADRHRQRDWYFPLDLGDSTRGFNEEVRTWLNASPVVVADNVADYVDQRGATDIDTYPRLSPPWPTFWVEYASTSGKQRRGVMVFDCTDPDSDTTRLCAQFHDGDNDTKTHPEHPLVNAQVDFQEVKWVVAFMLFVEDQREVFGPVGASVLSLNADGAVVGHLWSMAPLVELGAAIQAVASDEPDDPMAGLVLPTEADLAAMTRDEIDAVLIAYTERHEQLSERMDVLDEALRAGGLITDALTAMGQFGDDWLVRALAPAFQSVAFLHCKNVSLDEHVPSAKVQAKRRKKNREPLLRHHTLRLDVPRKASDSGLGDGERTHAMHIVAGHFAHYGACCSNHPPRGRLFGRHEGVYWVPSHVRGDRTVGTVRTDFDLNVRPSAVGQV